MKALLKMLFEIIRRSLPLSLRWQMVVWYTTAFTVLLLFTGALFYQYLEYRLEASIDTDLQLRAQQIAAEVVLLNGMVNLPGVTGNQIGFSTLPQHSASKPADVNYGELVRLLDAQGHMIAETPAFHALAVPTTSITQPLAGTPWQGTIKTPAGQEVRVTSRMLTDNGKTVALLQVGESLEPLHSLLHQLVAALLFVGLLVLGVCAAGSYWLAAYSFAPIQRLSETARKINAGDLHQRVPVPVIRDEVQFLALTFNEMLDSLEQAFVRQRRFVADASHELRTPVAVIRNTAGVALLEPPQLDETVTALQDIRSETERLTLLLTDLLTLSRGDEGQARFEHEIVQFDQLVETVVATTEVLAAEHAIHLSTQISHPVRVLGDEARLIQVVMNLLDNAIRYTNSGGQVWVTLEQRSEAVALSVRDTGIGIAPEHVPHIFERFYRADSTRRWSEGSGSGLGLSIVEWIVRSHGGSIVVESQVGCGSCFTVYLPSVSA